MLKKLVLFTPLPDGDPTKALLDHLNYAGELQVVTCLRPEPGQLRPALSGASALLCRPNDHLEFTPADLDLAVFPFVAGTLSSGAEHLESLKDMQGMTIVRSAGGNAGGVAELTINHAITLLRQTYTAQRAMERGLYEAPPGNRLEGKHWLVIGAGKQAQQLVAKNLGMGLASLAIYHDRMTPAKLTDCLQLIPPELIFPHSAFEYQIKTVARKTTIVTGTTDLAQAASKADLISLHVPPTFPDALTGRRGTIGMVNTQLLNLTKDRCCLINMSRGNIVVEQDVISWLRAFPTSHSFASDVLDQRAERERDPDLSLLHKEYINNAQILDPFRRINIILTPHIGGSATEDFTSVCAEVTQKVLEYLAVEIPVIVRRSL